MDVIAAEDTRHTMKLLTHYGISKPLVSYWGEKEKARSEAVMKRLAAGDSVALVSDAGTPGISDPGAVLIRKALDDGYDVVPVPGPSALLTALSISGLPTEEFTYLGFLPAKRGQRKRALEDLALERRTMVFYESPHRIIDALVDMEEAFGGQRPAALVRELTKIHEEVLRGTLSEVLDSLEEATVAGEYVVLVEGRGAGHASLEEALEEVAALIRKGMGRKQAAKTVASQYGLSTKELYDRSLKG